METATIEKKFNYIGARIKFSEPRRFDNRPFTIDIKKDKAGEFYDVRAKEEIKMMILDAQKDDRHLLLMIKDPEQKRASTSKFLCGHDERAWFTCAVPGLTGIPVSTVTQAKQALKPKELIDLERKEGLKTSKAQKRHRKLDSGKKIHRQGEFMFIPVASFEPPKTSLTVIHRNEPMRRGNAGNSHMAEYLYRQGGTTVYVSKYSSKAQNGFTVIEYNDVMKNDTEHAKKYSWHTMVRDPQVYTKGRITHKEHKTLDLGDRWHKVLLNTENKAKGFESVAFLD